MKHFHPLPEHLVAQATLLEEFANGAAQCHAQLSGGKVFAGLLISNATAIIAMREHAALPFEVASIDRLFQTEEDKSPTFRANWQFFDDWHPIEPQFRQPSTPH
jgi:hypothetical protein